MAFLRFEKKFILDRPFFIIAKDTGWSRANLAHNFKCVKRLSLISTHIASYIVREKCQKLQIPQLFGDFKSELT